MYNFIIRLAAFFDGADYVITRWDRDALMWYVEDSSVRGLSVEGRTENEMYRKVIAAVAELRELAGTHDDKRRPLTVTFSVYLAA